MRIVFMGSAELACCSLDSLLASPADRLVGVIAQPDRPKGRTLQLAACPVRAHIGRRQIPVLTPVSVNTPESQQAIKALAPDLIVVVAYGQILKPALLDIPPRGCVNLHASLLPRYRGAAPIQWAIARGERRTGVTTMFLNAAMDAGDIIDQIEEPIHVDDTAGTLHERLASLGAQLLLRSLDAIRQGTARRLVQDHAAATYAPKLKKSDGYLDWRRPAIELYNRIRGFNPWPGSYFELGRPGLGSGAIKVLQASVVPAPGAARGQPGEVLALSSAGPVVQTGEQALCLLELQPAGRKAMSANAFLCGHPLKVGTRLALMKT